MSQVATIKNKGGTISYRGTAKVSEDGVVVYNKSKTFAKKKLANEWAITHEVEVRKKAMVKGQKKWASNFASICRLCCRTGGHPKRNWPN
jgi:hypothetical protein